MSAAEAIVIPLHRATAEEPKIAYVKPTSRLPIPEAIAHLTHLPGTARKVLITVCQLHELKGKGCFAKNETLAAECGTSERSVTRYLAELKRQGLITGDVGLGRHTEPADFLRTAYLSGDYSALANLAKVATSQPSQSGERVAKVARLGSQSGEAPRQSGDHITYITREKDSSVVIELRRQLAATAALLATAQSDLTAEKKKVEDSQASVHHYATRYSDEVKAHQKTKAELERVKNPNKGKGKLITDAYTAWYTDRVGIEPPILAKDYVAALTIFNYLKRVSLNQTDEGAVHSFQYILSQWDRLEDFHQKQPNLASLNSNLANVMATLKHGKQKPVHTRPGLVSNDAVGQNLRDLEAMGLI